MLLESFITTVPTPTARPVKVADLGFRPGTKVTIPFGDSRLCDGITLDMHEPLVDKLFEVSSGVKIRDKALELALKVYYRDKVVFHGPLHAPEFDYATGKIALAAHDPTLRLTHAFAHAGQTISVDGEGMFSLLALGQNFAAEDTAGYPVLGIVPGKDTTTPTDVNQTLKKGDQIYQTMQTLQGLVFGPDMNFVPYETDPAELASGTDSASYTSTAAVIADNATTDFSLPITFTGNIGGLKLGTWVQHTEPGEINIDLVHPDGTSVRVYTGSKETTAASASGDFLGSGTGSACYFEMGHSAVYGGAYPHVGTFRSDHSLNAFLGKPATGTWKLRVHDTAATHTGTVNWFQLAFELPAPAYCRMDVSDKPDTTTLPAPVCVFMKGHGQDNARTMTVKPLGDLTRNYFTASSQAGGVKVKKNDTSRAAYGRYEGYENSGQPSDSADVLKAYASNEVRAYGRPLPSLDLAPKNDGGQDGILRYGEDFSEGDYVKAVGKKGHAYHSITARVMQVTLTNVQDQGGSSAVQTDLDVIPAVSLSGDISDG